MRMYGWLGTLHIAVETYYNIDFPLEASHLSAVARPAVSFASLACFALSFSLGARVCGVVNLCEILKVEVGIHLCR